MSKNFACADLHLSHQNILKYCNRPFSDALAMDNAIINNINAVVGQDDVLWVLGDFCFAREFGAAKALRDRIVCRNVNLVRGNHDHHSIKPLFSRVYEGYLETKIEGMDVVMCHYPMLSWNRSFHGSCMIFGHCHSRMNAFILEHLPQARILDVGVDSHGFTPWSFEEIKGFMSLKTAEGQT